MITKRKKIAYISGTRADFGLMTPVLKAIEQSGKLSLQLYVTGMHLMPEFGETKKLVQKEFSGTKTITAIFEDDSRASLARFCASLLPKITQSFEKDRPDFVLLFGDRPEMLCVAVACLYLGIPTGHFQGGEISATVDGITRHALTKLSSLHFPATKKSAAFIEKMGEEKWRIIRTGAPALDDILGAELPSRKELLNELGITSLSTPFILFVQHPYFEGGERVEKQIAESLAAIKLSKLPIVAIYPNADPGGRKIIKILERERDNPKFHVFRNVTHAQFLALEREAGVMVGNSSSGLIEAIAWRTPVVNVGRRQFDRERGKNVIDAPVSRKEIARAIKKALYDKRFLAKLRRAENPWGNGGVGKRVVSVLEHLRIDERLLIKK
ncbi:MAG TPA: UDP-N-acetylglucosamine 2-epimerase (hydrolyzing) [Candidatus Taylorbacteria bacterium]|nr:MAG: UDP-N-acetyl-D-glucosamine 2-epimerase, UDP-hydrolysing [Parcubacteria group bacterium GW2011_GWA2_47_64]KKU96540.1 MAG: UDP-N-acetyl-D-glucosamine 2-epimerase, UDP-hydrolysing [Parcubacteria group bacterium GW2011_GWC2_48_17]HBV01199.1 UDP-N-acetylglucosamine 2-epimerase (hydrolyzing) [Candidatus Taylorbacteria bacterium]